MVGFAEAMGNVANAGMILQMAIQAKDLTKSGLLSAQKNVKSFEAQNKTSMAAARKSVDQYNMSMDKTKKSVQGLTPAMQGINTSKLEQMGVKSTQTQGIFQRMTDSIKNNAKVIGGAMVGAASVVAGAYIMILKSAMNSAAQSEQKWGRLTIALGKSGFQIKEVKKEWSSTVAEIHASTGRMQGDITLSLGELAKFGLTNKQVMVDSIKSISALTYITQGDFAQISDTYSDMINRQQLMIRSVGNLGLNVDNFTRVLKEHGYELEDWKDLTKDQRAEMINLAIDSQNGADTVARANKEYADSYEGLMNRIDQFKKVVMTTIGNVLLPYAKDMLRDVIPVLKQMVDWFKALPDPIKKAVIALPLVVSGLMAVGGTVLLLTPLATMLTGLHTKLTHLITKVHEWNATPMLSKIASVTQVGGGAAAGVAGAQAAGGGMALAGGLTGTDVAVTAQAAAATQQVTTKLKEQTIALQKQAPIRARLTNDLGVIKNKMVGLWKSTGDSAGALQGLSGMLTMAAVGLAAMAGALVGFIWYTNQSSNATDKFNKAIKQEQDYIDGLKGKKASLEGQINTLNKTRDREVAKGHDVSGITKQIDDLTARLTDTTNQLNEAEQTLANDRAAREGLDQLHAGRTLSKSDEIIDRKVKMGLVSKEQGEEEKKGTIAMNDALTTHAKNLRKGEEGYNEYSYALSQLEGPQAAIRKEMEKGDAGLKTYMGNYEQYAIAKENFWTAKDEGDILGIITSSFAMAYYQLEVWREENIAKFNIWAGNVGKAIQKPFQEAYLGIKAWYDNAGKTLNDIGDQISAPFRKVYCWIMGCSPGIIPALRQLYGVFKLTFDRVRDVVMRVVDAIRQVVVGIGQRLAAVPQLMVGYFRRGVAMTREAIYGVVQFFRDIITRVRGVLGGIYQAINTPIRNAMNAAYGVVKSVTNSVSSAFWALVTGARNAWNSVANAVRGPINTIIGFVNTLRKALGMPIAGGLSVGNLSVGNIVSGIRGLFAGGDDAPGGGVNWKPDTTLDLSMIRNPKTRERILEAIYKGDILGPEGLLGWAAGDNTNQGFWQLSSWPKNIISAAKNLAAPWLKRFGIDINKFDISKPGALGAAAFYQFVTKLFDTFDHEFYYNHKYSGAEMLRNRRGNCWDMTSLLLNIASAFGLHGNMIHGTWNGIRHVWANIPPFGKMDPTAMAQRHCWTCGPSAGGDIPGEGGGKRETHIHLNFNEPVYGLDDFEGKVTGVLDKSLRWIQ